MNKKLKKTGGAIEKAFLYNKYVLYFIFLITLGYLFILLTLNDFYTFFIFILIGFLTSFFSKNMVVILSLAMSLSFILKYGTKIRPEGFQEGVLDASGNMLDASGNMLDTSGNPVSIPMNATTTTTTDLNQSPTSDSNQDSTPKLTDEEQANLMKQISTALNQT
jgi:hypothetical protein